MVAGVRGAARGLRRCRPGDRPEKPERDGKVVEEPCI